jgi:RNA polymerase sigma factor (sigma-70 family)
MMTTRTMMTREISDAELVSRSLAGDREAFSQIVTRYQTLICSLAYSGMGNLGQSEDVAQETFITAWRHLSHLREPDKLRSWLCGIVRNRIHKSLHREGREPASNAVSLEEEHDSACSAALPSEQTINREEEALLWRSLERMPEMYREPLILFYRQHQSVQQVAAALDLSEDAVKQRLSRGRRMLQEELLSFVEGALGRTTPGREFSGAVMAALPVSVVATAGAGVGVAGKGAAAAKSGGVMALLTTWLAPIVGIVGGITAHWIIARGAPTRAERRFKTAAFTIFWVFVLVWVLGVQPAIRALSGHFEWSARTFFAVMAGFWWLYGMVIATLSILVFRRVFAIRMANVGQDPGANLAPQQKGKHILLLTGVYLACFSWLINLAWQTGDEVWAGIITVIMLALGAWNYWQVRGRRGLSAVRAVVGHLALVWCVVLVLLNVRLDVWLAAARGIDLTSLHQLLPPWTVPLLTVALVLWIGIVLAITRRGMGGREVALGA